MPIKINKISRIISELEGETNIDGHLLLENAQVRQGIKDLVSNKITSTELINIINNQF